MADYRSWSFREYHSRAQAVYWRSETPACRRRGPGKARCLLEPDHEGPHFGNGFDQFGPTGAREWND